MAERGIFITIEGGEGAGKSTQIGYLQQWLQAQSVEAIFTREPGGTQAAEEIRSLLVTGEAGRWLPVSEAMLMMTARYEHVMHRIQPALAQGTWVVSDRFFDSTRVYQGIGKQLGDDWLQMLYRLCFGSFAPDITLYLDLDPQEGLKRTQLRSGDENRFESLPLSFHQQVRDGFVTLAKQEPGRFAVIDASASPIEAHQAMVSALNERLGRNWPSLELAA